jgi:uncharacterized protein (TIGR00296 family)
MNPEDGERAVRFARDVILDELTFKGVARDLPRSFDEPSGAFVTINTYPALALRGCIGYPGPSFPLGETIEHAARAACHDPRFLDLEEQELNEIVVEVTILTPPEPIIAKNKTDLLHMIIIGKHGLMLEYHGRRSVFLPQVPIEWKWSVLEYLENLCQKAGIGKDKWKDKDCHVLSFKGKIFRETTPYGEVVEVKG